jgi:hypothetical protein
LRIANSVLPSKTDRSHYVKRENNKCHNLYELAWKLLDFMDCWIGLFYESWSWQFKWRRWVTSILVVSSPYFSACTSEGQTFYLQECRNHSQSKSLIMGEWWVCCNEALVINFQDEISSTHAIMIFLPMSSELQWDWWYVTWNSCVTVHSSLSLHICVITKGENWIHKCNITGF